MQEWQTLCAPDKSPLLQRTRAKQEKYISLALQTPKSAGLRGGGMEKHRLGRVYLGGVVVVGRHPQGMPASFAPLPQICPL